jgi:NitT/TauT family transport system substrate-binding protein
MRVVTTLCAVMLALPAAAETVVLSVPGPGTLSYLPVYLAKAIAADQAEGIELKLRYVPGGPVALRDLNEKNCDFVAVGLAAVAASRADGMPVVAIGQLTQSAMYVFLLRNELKNQVRNISQLKGKRIGVASGTSATRSMGHMMMEHLLHRAGLKSSDVQFISIGQNRETQQAALKSGTVDAFMGDEPFASELVASGLAVKLVDLYQPQKSSELFGGPVVHAALATREDVLLLHPDTAKRVLRIYERTLQWMSEHTAQEVIDKLASQPGFSQKQGKVLADILQRNQGMYTSHVKWDNEAVATTERFFHSTAINPREINLPFADFVRNQTIR